MSVLKALVSISLVIKPWTKHIFFQKWKVSQKAPIAAPAEAAMFQQITRVQNDIISPLMLNCSSLLPYPK